MRLDRSKLSIIGLVVLALLAGALSLAALRLPSPTMTALQQPAVSPTTASTDQASTPVASEPIVTPSSAPSPTATPTTTESPSTDATTVLVIGDRYSLADAPDSWVDAAADELGWKIMNFASRQRGYLSDATDCDVEPCSSFTGTVDAIADRKPDMVITFGGTADGDQDLSEAAAAYFEDLRAALPDAELVAVAPVTTDDEWPYYLTMHARSIRAAVEAVDGTFIDSKRIGLGDGEELSEESQRELAKVIIEALR